VSELAGPLDPHHAALQRLGAWLRLALQVERQSREGDSQRELRIIEKTARELASKVADGPAALCIRVAADDLGFDHPKAALLALADTASYMLKASSNPRKKSALPRAAEAYLHLLYRQDRARPSMYEKSPEVVEFAALIERAGAPKSIQSARRLLTDARLDFDPLTLPYGMERVVGMG